MNAKRITPGKTWQEWESQFLTICIHLRAFVVEKTQRTTFTSGSQTHEKFKGQQEGTTQCPGQTRWTPEHFEIPF
jgi:hypothetical protein